MTGLVLPSHLGASAMASARGSYAKYWCFTENVDPEVIVPAIEIEGLPSGITYFCAQLEQGQRLHLQGYVELEARQRVTWLKRNLSQTAHFEIRRGTQEEAIAYCCKKDATTVDGTFVEFGEKTDEKKGKRNDLLDVKAMLDDGCSEREIAEQHFGSWCRYAKSFSVYRQLIAKKRNPDEGVEVIIHYGPTRAGKSRLARESYPDAYIKPVGSQWFDNYIGQETVIFEEYGGHWMPYGTLLSISDRYPCTVPVKGGHVEFSAKRLIFTTNRHPKQWYKGDYYDAFEARITKILFFEDRGIPPKEFVHPFDGLPDLNLGVPQPTNLVPGYRWN